MIKKKENEIEYWVDEIISLIEYSKEMAGKHGKDYNYWLREGLKQLIKDLRHQNEVR